MKKYLILLLVFIMFSSSCALTRPKPKIRIAVHEEDYAEPLPPPKPLEVKVIEKEGRTVCFYPCRYTHGEELRRILTDMVSTEGSVSFSEPLNLLVFSEPKREAVETMLEYVKQIDVYRPQVLVEAKVVEINIDDDFEFELSHLFEVLNPTASSKLRTAEITLTTPGTNPSTEGVSGTVIQTGGGVNNVKQVTNFLRLMVTEGKAEILSSPNLIVSAGNTASIITGEEVPVSNQSVVSGSIQTNTVFKRVGVKLRVTPVQITNEMAYLEVNPEVSTVVGYTSGETSNPIVAVRNTSTKLRVKHNELIAIGGLLREEERLLEKRIPVLSHIPVLGRLFRATREEKQRTQLVFFLRIQILPESKSGGYTIPPQGLKDKNLEKKINRMRGLPEIIPVGEAENKTETQTEPDKSPDVENGSEDGFIRLDNEPEANGDEIIPTPIFAPAEEETE